MENVGPVDGGIGEVDIAGRITGDGGIAEEGNRGGGADGIQQQQPCK